MFARQLVLSIVGDGQPSILLFEDLADSAPFDAKSLRQGFLLHVGILQMMDADPLAIDVEELHLVLLTISSVDAQAAASELLLRGGSRGRRCSTDRIRVGKSVHGDVTRAHGWCTRKA